MVSKVRYDLLALVLLRCTFLGTEMLLTVVSVLGVSLSFSHRRWILVVRHAHMLRMSSQTIALSLDSDGLLSVAGSNVVSVAEHVVMQILALVRNYIPAYTQARFPLISSPVLKIHD